MQPVPASPITRFYRDQALSRSLADIMALSFDRLEYTHDYIQWMFPLPERSPSNPSAALLTQADVDAFARDSELRHRLLESFRFMLNFYGLELRGTGAGCVVVPSSNFEARRLVWLTRTNHNYLRITRILRCLTLLGCKPEAQAFLNCLEALNTQHAKEIGTITLAYWKMAVEQPMESDPSGRKRPASILKIVPCLDSDEMAAVRQKDLDIPRAEASALGRSAVEVARRGHYLTRTGHRVNWHAEVQAAMAAKRSIPPDESLLIGARSTFRETLVQVSNESTLGAAHRLVSEGKRPLALNFANGVEPGGGFLNGARAQEESLCRSSALYLTLEGDPMYAAHFRRPIPDSSDWAIYSPDVPVFRADRGEECPSPWLLSFITCAAPVATRVGQPLSAELLQKRIHRILIIALAYRYSALVLGAWGCGAFGNDPFQTARDFRAALEGDFRGAFSDVVFAVTDWSPDRKFLGPFRTVFSEQNSSQ